MLKQVGTTTLVVGVLALAGCGGGAPIEDGSFLAYEIGGTTVRLTFQAEGGDYRTVGELVESDGTVEVAAGMPGHGETVDRRMYTSSRAPLELASFGPIWVAPDNLVEGGRAYGSPVSEVVTEDGRSLAVVRAGLGGALRGEWAYDVETGFLVRGSMGTTVSEGQGFRLIESNIPGLQR